MINSLPTNSDVLWYTLLSDVSTILNTAHITKHRMTSTSYSHMSECSVEYVGSVASVSDSIINDELHDNVSTVIIIITSVCQILTSAFPHDIPTCSLTGCFTILSIVTSHTTHTNVEYMLCT